MGACTSAHNAELTKASLVLERQQHAEYARQLMLDEQLEHEREVADRINREKENLRKKALPMIQRRQSCEEVLDLSTHSDEEFEIALRTTRSRSSTGSQSDSASNLEVDLALNDYAGKAAEGIEMTMTADQQREVGMDFGEQNIANMVSGGKVGKKKQVLDHIQQQYEEEQTASMNALRANKQMKRQQAKLDAEAESKWMIFRDSDAFDEADMVKVARFMDKMLKVSGKLLSLNTSNALVSSAAVDAQHLLPLHSSKDFVSSNPAGVDDGMGMVKNDALGIVDSESQNLGSAAAAEARRILISDSPSVISRRKQSQQSLSLRDSLDGVDNALSLDEEPDLRGAARTATISGIQAPRSLSTPTINSIHTSHKLADRHLNLDFPVAMLAPGSGAGSDQLTPLPAPAPAAAPTIQVRRGNSTNNIENLLLRGQVVITPTTAMSSSGKRGAGITSRSPDTSTVPPRQSEGETSVPFSSSNAGVSAVEKTIPNADAHAPTRNHADAIKKELVKNFDLQNFRLPSGFVTSVVSKAVVDVFKQGGKLSKESVHKLLRLSYRQFQTLPNTTKISLNDHDRLTIVGDIHGQLADLLYILDSSGLPSPTNKYIFNGDFVDRGPYGVEVMCVLLALYLSNPGQVTLNRGNHEDFAICCAYGFQKECCEKYDDITFGMFVEVFNHLPLFAVINDGVFVLHGGLFHTPDVKLAELDQIHRTEFTLRDIPESGESTEFISRDRREDYLKQLQRDALWSDPSRVEGFSPSARGAGVMFGPDIARSFCETNNISLVVRSHECCRTGFDLPYAAAKKSEDRNTLVTIFSASNYGGGGNSAAFMVFTRVGATSSATGAMAGDASHAHVQERRRLSSHTATPRTSVTGTELQYEVHYFHIDDQDESAIYEQYGKAGKDRLSSGASSRGGNGDNSCTDDGDDTASVSSQLSLRGDFSLHQLILRKRALLMRHFELMDGAMTGIVPKGVWMQVLQQVLQLHIDWGKMFPALVSEESLLYPAFDRGNRIDPDAAPETTCFVQYEKFLDHFSLSLEKFSTADEDEGDEPTLAADGTGGKYGDDYASVGERAATDAGLIGSAEIDNKSGSMNGSRTRARKHSITGHLVDSLYAHHNELSAIFSFFDMKKDQVISREEFKAGMFLVRQLQGENEDASHSTSSASSTLSTDTSDAEFEQECDQLLDIMNLNGSGFIDINTFFEMFRMSDAMRKRTEERHHMPQIGKRRASLGNSGKSAPTQTILVSGKAISGV